MELPAKGRNQSIVESNQAQPDGDSQAAKKDAQNRARFEREKPRDIKSKTAD